MILSSLTQPHTDIKEWERKKLKMYRNNQHLKRRLSTGGWSIRLKPYRRCVGLKKKSEGGSSVENSKDSEEGVDYLIKIYTTKAL